MNSVRQNITANYLAQVYVASIGLLTLPVLTHLMGAEAYGLVGFYAMLQAWFQSLDVGLSAVLAREASRYNSAKIDARILVRLKRILELGFGMIAIVGSISMISLSDIIASNWLNVEHLSHDTVVLSIALMGLIVGLRWQSSLYRALITGFERQVWLGYASVAVATFRFVIVIPIICLFEGSPVAFFAFQALTSFGELLVVAFKARKLTPQYNSIPEAHISELRPALNFVSQVAFTSIAWVTLTQIDKLILSNILSLSSFGYFTISVQISSAIVLLNTPISTAILPLLTRQHAAGDISGMNKSYRRFSQLISVAILPPTCVLLFMGPQLMFAWTGSAAESQEYGRMLSWYGVGNAAMCLAAFIYYAQYAYGNVKYHVIGNAIFLALYLPALYFAVRHAGALGAATTWMVLNLAFLFLWVPFVHKQLLTFPYLSWLTRDILTPGIAAASPFIFLLLSPDLELSRISGLALAVLLGCASLTASVSASSELRPVLASLTRSAIAHLRPSRGSIP